MNEKYKETVSVIRERIARDPELPPEVRERIKTVLEAETPQAFFNAGDALASFAVGQPLEVWELIGDILGKLCASFEGSK